MRKKMPEAIKMGNKIYIESKCFELVFKKFSKFAIKDFKQARERRVSEQWDNGEDIDIRFETDYTQNVVKNLECFSKNFLKQYKNFNESLKDQWEPIDGEDNGRK